MIPAQQLARLLELDERSCFRVMFCCSQAGDYDDRMRAESRAAQLSATSDWTKAHVIEPTKFDDQSPEEAKELLAETMPLLRWYSDKLRQAREVIEMVEHSSYFQEGEVLSCYQSLFSKTEMDSIRQALVETDPEKEQP